MRAVLLLLVLFLAVACHQPVDVYPSEVVQNFLRSCQVRADAKVCRCAINALQQRFTLDEYHAFEARIAKGEIPKEAADVVDGCRR